MIAVARPSAAPARSAAVLRCGGRVVRAVLLFVLDVLTCLASILQPAFWSAVALAVAVALGQTFVALGLVAFGGFVVGSLAVCVVGGVLGWADHRHRWWSR